MSRKLTLEWNMANRASSSKFGELIATAIRTYRNARDYETLGAAEEELCFLASSRHGEEFSVRTLRRWKKGTVPRRSNLIAILKVLLEELPSDLDRDWARRVLESADMRASLTDLLVAIDPVATFDADAEELPEEVFAVAQTVDETLLALIRDHSNAPQNLVLEEHALVVGAELAKRNLDRQGFMETLRNGAPAPVVHSLPATSLEVDLQSHGSEVSVTYDLGAQQLRIQPAHLLWNCTCQDVGERPGYLGKPNSRCPIHGHPLGVEIDAHFREGLVKLRVDGTPVLWRSHSAAWPPSIDTLTMMQALADIGVFKRPYGSVLDLGCGTGILGIMLASRNRYDTSVTFVDWLLTPLLWASVNWAINRPSLGAAEATFELALTPAQLSEERRYDIVVCNPPYLPVPPEHHHLRAASTVAGTELLEDVIARARDLGERVYVSLSHLAMPEATRAAAQAGTRLTEVSKPHDVPFRVPRALEDREYVQWLIDERGLDCNRRDGFNCWHSVQTFRVV